MYRNLDLVSLRTLIAIADTGGMTRAANVMHLTQSAVSMQVKRLEAQLSLQLLEREGRNVTPTLAGEQLVTYARRLVDLNDEALRVMVQPHHDVTIKFGVPVDLVYPFMPGVLQKIQSTHPRYRVEITVGMTYDLRHGLRDGLYDVILTTEKTAGPGGSTMVRQPLVWSTAVHGTCWQNTPVPLAFSPRCMFLKPAIAALEAAGMAWHHIAPTTDEVNAQAGAAADLGLRAELACTQLSGVEPVDHKGSLPPLPDYAVVIYFSDSFDKRIAGAVGELVSDVFTDMV